MLANIPYVLNDINKTEINAAEFTGCFWVEVKNEAGYVYLLELSDKSKRKFIYKYPDLLHSDMRKILSLSKKYVQHNTFITVKDINNTKINISKVFCWFDPVISPTGQASINVKEWNGTYSTLTFESEALMRESMESFRKVNDELVDRGLYEIPKITMFYLNDSNKSIVRISDIIGVTSCPGREGNSYTIEIMFTGGIKRYYYVDINERNNVYEQISQLLMGLDDGFKQINYNIKR